MRLKAEAWSLRWRHSFVFQWVRNEWWRGLFSQAIPFCMHRALLGGEGCPFLCWDFRAWSKSPVIRNPPWSRKLRFGASFSNQPLHLKSLKCRCFITLHSWCFRSDLPLKTRTSFPLFFCHHPSQLTHSYSLLLWPNTDDFLCSQPSYNHWMQIVTHENPIRKRVCFLKGRRTRQ